MRHDRLFFHKSLMAHSLFSMGKVPLTPVQEQSEARKNLRPARLGLENFLFSFYFPLSGLHPFRAFLAPGWKNPAVHLLTID